jgi:hypothetical protein
MTDCGRGTGMQSNEGVSKFPKSFKGRIERTAFDPDDDLEILSKILTEVFVEPPQEDIHL